MENRVDFDINESLKNYLSDPASLATPEASSALLDCENDPESLSEALINTELEPIIDAVADNPDNITRSSIFDSFQFLLKCAPTVLPDQNTIKSKPNHALHRLSRYTSHLPPNTLSKILDVLVSALAAQADVVHADLESDEQESIQHHKQVLEIYAFLLQWSIATVETKAAEKAASTSVARGRGTGKGAKGKAAAGKEAAWDPSTQVLTALDVMSKVLKLKLGKIFLTTSERDTFISLFTRPVYQVLESEARVKSAPMRMHAFKVLCIAVKHHGHAFGIGIARVMAHYRLTNRPIRRANVHSPESVVFRTSFGTHGRISPHTCRAI